MPPTVVAIWPSSSRLVSHRFLTSLLSLSPAVPPFSGHKGSPLWPKCGFVSTISYSCRFVNRPSYPAFTADQHKVAAFATRFRPHRCKQFIPHHIFPFPQCFGMKTVCFFASMRWMRSLCSCTAGGAKKERWLARNNLGISISCCSYIPFPPCLPVKIHNSYLFCLPPMLCFRCCCSKRSCRR